MQVLSVGRPFDVCDLSKIVKLLDRYAHLEHLIKLHQTSAVQFWNHKQEAKCQQTGGTAQYRPDSRDYESSVRLAASATYTFCLLLGPAVSPCPPLRCMELARAYVSGPRPNWAKRSVVIVVGGLGPNIVHGNVSTFSEA
jgi:hypothetical protein